MQGLSHPGKRSHGDERKERKSAAAQGRLGALGEFMAAEVLAKLTGPSPPMVPGSADVALRIDRVRP